MTGKRTDKRILVGVRLPVALARQLKVVAARHSTTVQALIEQAVVAMLRPSPESDKGARRGQK